MTLTTKIKRILLVWILSLVAINILSFMPHYSLHFLSWVNFALYLLASYIALAIAGSTKYLNDIFVLLFMTCFFIFSTIFTYFCGDGMLFGDKALYIRMVFYGQIIGRILFTAVILQIVLRYLLPKWKKGIILAVTLLAILILEYDFIVNALSIDSFARKTFSAGILRNSLKLDIVSVFALLAYFVFLYFKDRPNGAFMNILVIVLLIWFVFDIFDFMATIQKIDVYGLDQYFALFCILLLNTVLFLRLVALHSEGHVLREKFIFDPQYALNTPVIMNDTQLSSLMEQIKILVHSQSFLLQIITAITIILISGLAKSLFVTIKLLLSIFLIAVIWNVYRYIIHNRAEKGQILNFKFLKKEVILQKFGWMKNE
jgi:hypothetical protein